jgi:hypothetical protein
MAPLVSVSLLFENGHLAARLRGSTDRACFWWEHGGGLHPCGSVSAGRRDTQLLPLAQCGAASFLLGGGGGAALPLRPQWQPLSPERSRAKGAAE